MYFFLKPGAVQNHRNASGAIVLSYYYYNEDDTNNNPQDTLDDSKSLATPRQAVTLEGCRLEGNSFVSGDEENSLGLGGIIQVGTEYNDLALRECIFWNNSYNNDAADIETAVSSTSNVCFVANLCIPLESNIVYYLYSHITLTVSLIPWILV